MSTPFRMVAFCLILSAVSVQHAWAMGQESFGPAGEHIGRSGDWPKGVEQLLRHPSRVYWYWVNGNEHAYYDGDIETVNELLDLFAQVDLTVHQVVLRPGRPSARSFHGKVTPYAVKFEIPGGIYLHHIQEYATTGLYSGRPRLIVQIDSGLAENLDQLKIPGTVSLQDSRYRVEAAVAQVDALERSLRARAIAVLGEAGDPSPAVMEVLKRASADEDEYIRGAAQRAITQIEQANDPSARKLQAQVGAFLSDHPQRQRVPEPGELLKTLRRIDDRYAKGFTAKGTMIQPTLSTPGKLIAWTLTMGDDRLVLEQRAIENENHPPTAGQVEDTIYTGPDQMAIIHRARIWADGELLDTEPHATFEPVGSTYDLLIGRVLWPLGRGFSRRIDRILLVAEKADGTLAVMAESDEGNLKLRWEMWIDSDADFLVRFAKGFHRDQLEPSYIIDNAGTLVIDDRCTAHTGRWTEGSSARPVSISVTSVSAKTDDQLVRRTEDWLKQQSE